MPKILLPILLGLILTALIWGCGTINKTELVNPDLAVGWAVGKIADGYGTILHTTNGGATWVRQGTSETIPDADLGEVAAVDNNTAWVVSGALVAGYGLILHTTDGGATWTRQGSPSTVPYSLFDVRALNKNVAWVCGSNGTLLKTTDGGATWGPQAVGLFTSEETIAYVAIGDADHVWLVGYHPAGKNDTFIYYSTDGGDTWTQQAAGNPYLAERGPIDLCALDAEHAWLVGVNELVMYTGDSGEHWNSISWFATSEGGLAHANGVCAFDPQTVWVARDYGTMYYTATGGATWEVFSPSASGGSWLMRVTGYDPRTIWATGILGYAHPTTGRIIHTRDGGQTWTAQTLPVDIGLRGLSFAGAKR
jgi:photosystem II stability/assembly factor-like uncharacterized protein